MKKGLLPVVTKEIAHLVQAEILKNKNYIVKSLEHIRENNPLVADFIEDISLSRTKNIDSSLNMIYSSTVVYSLLEKEGPLPVVSRDICGIVQEELLQTQKNDYVISIMNQLKEDNPHIISFVANLATKSHRPLEIAYASLIVYKLLERQAESDLKKQVRFGLPQDPSLN